MIATFKERLTAPGANGKENPVHEDPYLEPVLA